MAKRTEKSLKQGHRRQVEKGTACWGFGVWTGISLSAAIHLAVF